MSAPGQSLRHRIPGLLPLLAGAGLTGWLFARAGVPVGWLLGPMAAGVIVSIRQGRPQALSPAFQLVGQVLLGLAIGTGFSLETLKVAGVHALPLAGVVLLTGALSLGNGYLLWRWAGVDRATGFMGSLPGAASSMVAMSAELGAEPVMVAVLQYLRLMLVIFLAPPLAAWLFPVSAAGAATAIASGLPAAAPVVNLLLLTTAGLGGLLAARLLHLPSPSFLGPVLGVVLLSWSLGLQLQLPAPAFALGLLLVGLSIGRRFDLSMARQLGKAALIETGLVIILILVSLVVGRLFHSVTGVDTMTAVLGSTPGGMEVMVASAVDLGADLGLVLAMHMTRWFMILLIGPWVTRRLLRGAAQAVRPE